MHAEVCLLLAMSATASEEELIAEVHRLSIESTESRTAASVHQELQAKGWSCTVAEVKRACSKARKRSQRSSSLVTVPTPTPAIAQPDTSNGTGSQAAQQKTLDAWEKILDAEKAYTISEHRRWVDIDGDREARIAKTMEEILPPAMERVLDTMRGQGGDPVHFSQARINADLAIVDHILRSKGNTHFEAIPASEFGVQVAASMRRDAHEYKHRLEFHKRSRAYEEREGRSHSSALLTHGQILDHKLAGGLLMFTSDRLQTEDGWSTVREEWKEEQHARVWAAQLEVVAWCKAHGQTPDRDELNFARNCGACGARPVDGVTPLICKKCQLMTYCSAECQKRGWRRGHKKSCGKILLTSDGVLGCKHSELIHALHEFAETHAALCCCIMMEVSRRTARYTDEMIEAGAVGAAVAAMRAHPKDHAIQVRCCEVLRNMSANTRRSLNKSDGGSLYSAVVPVGEETPQHAGRNACHAAGAAECVVTAMSTHPTDTNVQEEGLASLMHFCLGHNWELFEAVIAAGGLSAATNALQVIPGVALITLANMCNSEILHSERVQVQTEKTVLAGLKDLKVLEHVCDAVTSLPEAALPNDDFCVGPLLAHIVKLLSRNGQTTTSFGVDPVSLQALDTFIRANPGVAKSFQAELSGSRHGTGRADGSPSSSHAAQ